MALIPKENKTIIPDTEEVVAHKSPEDLDAFAKKAALAAESLGMDYNESLSRYKVLLSSGKTESVRGEISDMELRARKNAEMAALKDALKTNTTDAAVKAMERLAVERYEEKALEKQYLESLESKMPEEWKVVAGKNQDAYSRRKNIHFTNQLIRSEISNLVAEEDQEGILKESLDFTKAVLAIPNLLDNYNFSEGTFRDQVEKIKKQRAFISKQPVEVQPDLVKQLVQEVRDSRLWDNPQEAIDILTVALGTEHDLDDSVAMTSLDALFFASEVGLAIKGAKRFTTGITRDADLDVVTAEAIASPQAVADDIVDGTKKIIDSDEVAAEIMSFLRNPGSAIEGVGEQVRKRQKLVSAKIVNALEKFSAPERLSEVLARETKRLEDEVLNRAVISSRISEETGNLEYIFGTSKGVPFASKKTAEKAARDKGIEPFNSELKTGYTIEEGAQGWVVKVHTDTHDAFKGFNELGWIGKHISNVEDTVKALLPLARAAEDANSQLSKVFKNIIDKDLSPFLKGKKSHALNQVIKKGQDDEVWYTSKEFRQVYEQLNGKPASDKEINAYLSYRKLNDMAFYLTSKEAVKDMAARGDKVFDLPSLKGGESKLGVAGREVDKSVVLGHTTNKEDILVWGEGSVVKYSSGEFTKEVLEEIDNFRIVEVNPRWTEEFMYLGHSDVPVKYMAIPEAIAGRNASLTDVMGYVKGGRKAVSNSHFIKSAQIVTDAKGNKYRLQDVTLASASSSKQAKEGAEKFSKLLSLMKGARNDLSRVTDEAVESIGLDDFGIRTVKEANEYLTRHGLYDKSVAIQGLGDREVVMLDPTSFKEVKVMDNSSLSPNSQSLFGARTEGVRHITGGSAQYLDPMSALVDSLNRANNYASGAGFRERSLQYIKEVMGKYLDTDNPNPFGLIEADVKPSIRKKHPKIANAVKAHQMFLRSMLAQPTDFEISWQQWVEDAFEWVFGKWDKFRKQEPKRSIDKKTGEFLDPLQKRQNVIDAFGKDPITKIRSLTFHTTLGLFSLPSFIMQAINMTNIMAVSKHGTKAAMQSTFLRAGLFANDRGQSFGRFWKEAGFKSKEEYIDYVEEFSNLGFDFIGHNHALIAGLNGAQLSGTRLTKFLDMGRVFFDQGELLNRLTAYGAARKKWDLEVGKGKPASSVEGREFIREETHRLTLGMSRADLQLGLRNNLVSIPTQFMSYPLRLINAMAPVALGGSRAWTSKEKLRLALVNFALYGSAGIPLADYFANHLTQNFDMPPAVAKQITNGLIDNIFFTMSDGQVKTNFSGRAGVGEFVNQLWDAFVTPDKNTMELLGGAAGSRLTNFTSSADEFLGLMQSMVNPSFESVSDAAMELLAENIASLKTYKRAWVAYEEGLLYSRHGSRLARITKPGAIGIALGIPPQAYEEIGDLLDNREERKERIKEEVGLLDRLYRGYMNAQDEESRQLYREAIEAKFLLLQQSGLALDVSHEYMQQQRRGPLNEYLVNQEKLLKAGTPEGGEKHFSEQVIRESQ